jgi:hypothetical protein
MKTSELTGAALDWAVAKCEGGTNFWSDGIATHWIKLRGEDRALSGGWAQAYLPSTDWAQGGPIIEREMIQITPHCMVNPLHGWAASYRSFDEDDDVYALFRKRGKTPLIAAMRCYVASKLGDEVEIPEELL